MYVCMYIHESPRDQEHAVLHDRGACWLLASLPLLRCSPTPSLSVNTPSTPAFGLFLSLYLPAIALSHSKSKSDSVARAYGHVCLCMPEYPVISSPGSFHSLVPNFHIVITPSTSNVKHAFPFRLHVIRPTCARDLTITRHGHAFFQASNGRGNVPSLHHGSNVFLTYEL